MSVIIFVDQADAAIKKHSFEALSYGAKLAEFMGQEAAGIVLGNVNDDLSSLGKYGVKKIYQLNKAAFDHLDTEVFTEVMAEVVQQTGATVIIFSNSLTGKAVASRLSARLKAGLVSGAVALPDLSNGFVVKKNVFSGKAFAYVSVNTAIKIIALNPNSYTVSVGEGSAIITALEITVPAPRIKVTATNKVTGVVPLGEAELVISGGRGLKGPENWGMVEELAGLLGAATACSRAVADAHWRPHHEHVGQTGLAIAPNLYFAIGISGAIQHLAGVNRSKVIVVINKDPEAPFFKAADYGIVGDAFEVMPKIIESVRKLKSH
jgi:electron transfer flavoprotein alpha subunit